MLIDWFTVLAQLVNFAILVIVLKFLLYDRIIGAMETRRRSIAEREATADDRAREAEEELARLRQERRDFDRQRDEILEAARQEAADQQRELLHQAREDLRSQEEEWRESIRSRQDRLLADMQRLTGEKAVTVSRRILADMADMSVEEAVVRGLVERVAELSDEERSAIAEAMRADDSPILVRSAFEPSAASRASVEKVLGELVGEVDRAIVWEQDPELISGVVIRIGARTVDWSMMGYLEEVEEGFANLLRSETSGAQRHGEQP